MTLVPGTGDSLEHATTVGAYYIGKFLNGHVFDTNVADTAMKHRIYNSSSDYSVLKVSLPDKEESEESEEQQEGSVVKGFSKCMLDYEIWGSGHMFSIPIWVTNMKASRLLLRAPIWEGNSGSHAFVFWIYVPPKD